MPSFHLIVFNYAHVSQGRGLALNDFHFGIANKSSGANIGVFGTPLMSWRIFSPW
jgi:hypothetical protein